MAHSSSISSSENPTARWLPYVAGGLLAIWCGYALFGSHLAAYLADGVGPRLRAQSQGRIVDPRRFLEGRVWDAAWLLTWICAAILAGFGLNRWVVRKIDPLWRWLPLSIFVFIISNGVLLIAAQTNLFWCALYVAGPNLKQAAFYSERLLLRESKAPCKVVVVGSSQGQSEIATGRLNARFYPQAQFANLSYAGSHAFDLLLLQENYLDLKPDMVVCYLSELNLYSPFSGGRFLPFLSPRGLADYVDLWPMDAAKAEDIAHGMQGMILPAFRLRRAIEFAMFDSEAGEIKGAKKAEKESSANETPSTDSPKVDRLAVSAERTAQSYSLGPTVEGQKRSIERFLERNRANGIRTVLILGQVNPVLLEKLPTGIHDDFVDFVRSLRSTGEAEVVVLDELSKHTQSEYSDLMHITPKAREKYTDEIAEAIAPLIADESPSAGELK